VKIYFVFLVNIGTLCYFYDRFVDLIFIVFEIFVNTGVVKLFFLLEDVSDILEFSHFFQLNIEIFFFLSKLKYLIIDTLALHFETLLFGIISNQLTLSLTQRVIFIAPTIPIIFLEAIDNRTPHNLGVTSKSISRVFLPFTTLMHHTNNPTYFFAIVLFFILRSFVQHPG